MKKILILLATFLPLILIQSSVSAEATLAQTLKGRILLQVESRGEAWYVNPADGKRIYLKDGATAYSVMRTLGLGITNTNLLKIPIGLMANSDDVDSDNDGLIDEIEISLGTDINKADTDNDGHSDGSEVSQGYNPNGNGKLAFDNNLINSQKGRILLQVQSKGESWYVNPADGKRYYLKNGIAAYELIKKFGIGITNANLNNIPVSQQTFELPPAPNIPPAVSLPGTPADAETTAQLINMFDEYISSGKSGEVEKLYSYAYYYDKSPNKSLLQDFLKTPWGSVYLANNLKSLFENITYTITDIKTDGNNSAMMKVRGIKNGREKSDIYRFFIKEDGIWKINLFDTLHPADASVNTESECTNYCNSKNLEYSYNDYNSQTKECYCTYEQTPVEDTSSLAVQNCEQKTPGSMRDYCYNDYAKTHLDEQYCKKVSSKNRAGCYKQLARLKGNPFICDKSWDDNECLKQFDPYAIGVQTNGGNVILTDRSYNNSVLTVSFMPKVELMLKDLLLSKNGQNIELTGVGLNNASRLGSGLGSAFTTSNYKNETYKFYPNNEYIIYLDAKSPINVEDIFVLSWGGQNTLNITLDLPAIESVSANYDNGIVNVNYHNSGGQGEVYLNEPTVKKANNDPVFCMEPIESLGIHSIGAGENLTINYYCDQYYTSAEIGDIEICTYANQSPPEICKTYN